MNVKHLLRDAALMAAAMASVAGLTGCKDDFDTPPINIPVATLQPNTTIEELKSAMWDDATNYAVVVPQKEDGSDYIVRGRVISSDATGNIYKSLVIQDETGALPMSINQNSLYNSYRVGQEVVINVTGIYIGKYAGYEQLGGYGEYNGTPQTSFMSFETFQEHAELNGLPEPTMTIINADGTAPGFDKGIYCIAANISDLSTTPEGQRKWQGQLVEFRNVHFEGGGSEPYVSATDYENNASTSRTLLDASGNSIIVRNSRYASFAKEIMPSGDGTVRGILSYFNGSWQLLLRSTADCIFDSKGNQDDPYTVEEAIELQGTGAAGWTKGYIVGSVKGGVTAVTASDQIIWGADAEMDNTLVIGPSADTKDITKCMIVELPQGSAFREYGNLLDNPGVYQKAIMVYGTFGSVLSTAGITGNTGSASEFKIDGVTIGTNPGGEAVGSLYCDFEGYSTQISNLVAAGWTATHTSGDKNWYLTTFSGNTYAAATAYKGTSGPWNEWLISPAIDLDKSKTKTLSFTCQAAYPASDSGMRVYVMNSADPNTATKTELQVTLPTIPASGYSSWVTSNVDLSAFSGIVYIAWEYYGASSTTSSTYCIDDVNIGGAEGGNPGGDNPGGDDDGEGSQTTPYSVSYVQNTTTDQTGVWVEGWVVGYVKGTTWSTGATFSNDLTGVAEDSMTGYVNTNFILGTTSTTTSTAACIPCNIKAGTCRDILGFRNNPEIYLKHVKVKGDITKYFGIRGLKNVDAYEIVE